MNARFDFHGYELVITDDGTLIEGPNEASARAVGQVGFQMLTTHGEYPGDKAEPRTLARFFMAPSHARAVASAMLSAANAVKA
jgi:hypothetical protein